MYFYIELNFVKKKFIFCRNPCYNGRCISTVPVAGKHFHRKKGRNPCYNGRCISTHYDDIRDFAANVAILVIMEDVFLLKSYNSS